jgi:hypothetical protein
MRFFPVLKHGVFSLPQDDYVNYRCLVSGDVPDIKRILYLWLMFLPLEMHAGVDYHT